MVGVAYREKANADMASRYCERTAVYGTFLPDTLVLRYPRTDRLIWEQACTVGGGGVHLVEVQAKQEIFRYSSRRSLIRVLAVTIAVSFVIGAFMSRVHILLSFLFPEKASFPYLDALTTIASFTAMWLLAQKRIESWYYWIVVDVIGIGLYYVKGVRFITLLYVILLCMAINGLISWNKSSKTPKSWLIKCCASANLGEFEIRSIRK